MFRGADQLAEPVLSFIEGLKQGTPADEGGRHYPGQGAIPSQALSH